MVHKSLTIEAFTEPTFGENAYVVSAPSGGLSGPQAGQTSHTVPPEGPVGWVIDPSFSPAIDELLQYVFEKSILIEKIVLTHGHADHIAGLDVAKTRFPQAQVWIARQEAPMLQDAWLNVSAPFGTPITVQTRADADLAPGIKLSLGGFDWMVVDVSGHSPGGRALLCADAGVAIVGDALFQGSIGRTDFPGSDHAGLLRRIRENLLNLPDGTVVYSGHGSTTTVGNERKFNPFLSD